MESGGFIAGIKLVKQQILADQPFVDVLRGKVDAVIVVKEGAQRFANVAVGAGELWIGKTSQHVGIMMVIELSWLIEVTGEAIAL